MQPQIQILNGAVAIAEARVEFAFAQGEYVGAQLEALLIEFGEPGAVALFKRCAASAFLEGLHPKGFGDVRYRFGQAV